MPTTAIPVTIAMMAIVMRSSTRVKPPSSFRRVFRDMAHLPRRRVLVVDDNMDSAESLALLLRMEGHQVSVANDGESAASPLANASLAVVVGAVSDGASGVNDGSGIFDTRGMPVGD